MTPQRRSSDMIRTITRSKGPDRRSLSTAMWRAAAVRSVTAMDSRPLATSSLIAGILSFLPAPGPLAGLIAVVLGLLCPTDHTGRRPAQARVGIALGAVSVLLLA